VKKPSKAFSARLSAARAWRREVEPDIREIMRFCAPHRANAFQQSPHRRNRSETDTFISIGEEMATDLAGDLVNFYMPAEMRWAEYEVMVPIPEDAAPMVKDLVESREERLFDLLEQSNLNEIAPQIMFETASHGTPAVWIDSGHLAEPVYIEVVPADELLVTPGHLGISDRFREKWIQAEFLEAQLPGTDLSDVKIAQKMKKPGAWCKVCWGFWLDWSDPGNPQWKREITVDNTLVTENEEVIGPINGACPLMVGRFNPSPGNPWGRGPGIKALPDLMVLDKIEEVVLGKLDEQLDPAWSYVDDGVLNFANGIVGGHAYPRRSPEMPQPLIAGGDLDYGFYTKDGMEERIRVAFYQDGPRQRGQTPPTASQWLDERRRVQARLGKPSAPLFSELLLPMIQRVEYIGVAQGQMESAITIDGTTIQVRPISPMSRSQNQDKAMITRSNLDLGAQVFAEQMAEVVDIKTTYRNIADATGDELIAFNDKPKPQPTEGQPQAQAGSPQPDVA
jgi:hypothetical protein